MLLYSFLFLLMVLAMRRGQAFEVFRLLIAAVVAGAILMVLLQILGGFVIPTQNPQNVAVQYVKNNRTYGGTSTTLDPITFKRGTTIDLRAVAREAAVSKECLVGAVDDSLKSKFSINDSKIEYTSGAKSVANVRVSCVGSDEEVTLSKNNIKRPDGCSDDIWCVVAVVPK